MNLTIDSSLQHIMYNGNAVQKLIFNGHEVWSAYHPHDYSLDYFTIVSKGNNNKIYWIASNTNLKKTISISTDGGISWTNKTSATGTGTLLGTLSSGDKMLVKGTNTAYGTVSYYNSFHSSGNCDIEGNIMSLIYGDNFVGQTEISVNYAFYGLFNSFYVVDANNFILPAITLSDGCYKNMFFFCDKLNSTPVLPATIMTQNCYYGMFQNCTALTTAPELPATTLANQCYGQMFYGCTSLITPPELPVTTLATNCYYGMFRGCTALTTAPELPATTLANQCYRYMFNGCSKLNYIKCLATDISASYATMEWLKNVSSTGTFVKDADMTGWPSSDSGIPSGWTVQDYADYSSKYLTIVSTTANNSISWATKSNNVTKTISVSTDGGSTWTSKTSSTSGVLLATLNSGDKLLIKGTNDFYATSNTRCNYFKSSGTFNVQGNILSLIYGDNFVGQTELPEYDYIFCRLFTESNIVDASNLILPPMTQYYCYFMMFYQCYSLTKAPELPAMTLSPGCYRGMFNSCWSMTAGPSVLPAPGTATQCYDSMFNGCSLLDYIKCLATDISAIGCTQNWVQGVKSSGTFVKAASMSDWTTGISGIPNGWTVINI